FSLRSLLVIKRICSPVHESCCANIKIVGSKVCGRLLPNGRFFTGGDFCLKLICNCLGYLALNGEHVGQIAIITLCPEMFVGASIDQLRVNADPVTRTLNASLQHIRHAELLADLAQIAWVTGLVEHYRSAADDFQVGDLGK